MVLCSFLPPLAFTQSNQPSKEDVEKLLASAQPTQGAALVFKALMQYRNSGGVSCHSGDLDTIEKRYKQTGALSLDDATEVVNAYIDCTRELGSGPPIEGVKDTKFYAAALEKQLRSDASTPSKDPISVMIAGVRDVESALDAHDYVQALVNYEALRSGSTAVSYRRAHRLTATEVGRNPYTNEPALAWTPEYWLNIKKDATELRAEDLPFVQDYLQRTTSLSRDLKTCVELQARLTIAMRTAVGDDPLTAKQLCDSAAELQSRITDTTIRQSMGDRLAIVRTKQQEREKAFRQGATLTFRDAGSMVQYQFIGKDATDKRTRTVIACGDQITCIAPGLSGELTVRESADSRLRIHFNLKDGKVSPPRNVNEAVPRNAAIKWEEIFVPGTDLNFDVAVNELWPARVGPIAYEHESSASLRINGAALKLPGYCWSFTEKVHTPPSLTELLSGSVDREYTLNIHLYSEQARELFRTMALNLNKKSFATLGSIDEMVLDISIIGSWQAGAARQNTMVADQSQETAAPQPLPAKTSPQVLVVYEGYDKSRADAIAKNLLQKFLPAFVISTRQAQREKFEVQVGPFMTEAERNYARMKLSEAGYTANP
jgi:hypothetical protein